MKKQTRRSISLSEKSYGRLQAYAVANNRSMSGVVEELIASFFDREILRQRTPVQDGNVLTLF